MKFNTETGHAEDAGLVAAALVAAAVQKKMLSLDVVPPPPLPVKLLVFDTAPLPTTDQWWAPRQSFCPLIRL